MIKLLHIIILLIFGPGFSLGQSGQTGIFKNAEDFSQGKVTHAGKHTQIRLHELFEKDHIEVKYHDSTFSYLKKDVFGYVDKDGFTYRFFKNSVYPILNPYEPILLYKKTSGTGMKNSPIIESYFFSKDAGSEILPLTLANLEHAFFNEKAFTDLVEIHFKSADDLIEYDVIHKMYKLNRLLQISHEQKNN